MSDKNYDFGIGIDLGTTYSVISVCRGGRDTLALQSNAGDNGSIVPSVIAFTEQGVKVGVAAKKWKDTQHRNNKDVSNKYIYDAKRLIGRRIDEKEIAQDIKNFPFKVVERKSANDTDTKHKSGCAIVVEVGNYKEEKEKEMEMPPEVISSFVLGEMKRIAEHNLGAPVNKAVITVPAHFDNSMRQATLNAAKLAKLEVIRLINEPTAAAFSYVNSLNDKAEGKIMVFDLGGGTLDVTVLSYDSRTFSVECSSGDLHLGGRDWDANLEKLVMRKIDEKYSSLNKKKLQRVRNSIMEIKHQLSGEEECEFAVDESDEDEKIITITREEFENCNSDLWKRCIDVVDNLFKDAEVDKSCIDQIILVGGSSRMPKIRKILEEYFPHKRITIGGDPDLIVAYGASLLAFSLLNKTSDSISVSDVTSHDLGVAVKGREMSVLIKKYSSLPAKGSNLYSPASDFAPQVLVELYQGNYFLVESNHKVGTLEIKGYVPGRDVVLKVELSLNTDGVITMTTTLPQEPKLNFKLTQNLIGSHVMDQSELQIWGTIISLMK
eukprot:TRINITY_DN1849_c0_g1_i1.p1 TRINITY_DN1849_c0_g1~~TRINITY_DN1849_c0_g1_i1.p1  ORF type:complete len:566 (-),score=110.56 TRINITY_DN1849_c0_g1_i1:59-1705(-)